MIQLLNALASSQNLFTNFTRVAIFIVMVWIGGLKAFQYEADGIVPFVANSPLMSFFYAKSDELKINDKGEMVATYAVHKNPEGKVVAKNIAWHESNGRYLFSYGLGTVIIIIGFLVLLGIWHPKIGIVGGLLTFIMSIVTLSFLITTPETFVPNLGGDYATPQYGFPYLSGAGRLVIKDIIMAGAGLSVASQSAQKILQSLRREPFSVIG